MHQYVLDGVAMRVVRRATAELASAGQEAVASARLQTQLASYFATSAKIVGLLADINCSNTVFSLLSLSIDTAHMLARRL